MTQTTQQLITRARMFLADKNKIKTDSQQWLVDFFENLPANSFNSTPLDEFLKSFDKNRKQILGYLNAALSNGKIRRNDKGNYIISRKDKTIGYSLNTTISWYEYGMGVKAEKVEKTVDEKIEAKVNNVAKSLAKLVDNEALETKIAEAINRILADSVQAKLAA